MLVRLLGCIRRFPSFLSTFLGSIPHRSRLRGCGATACCCVFSRSTLHQSMFVTGFSVGSPRLRPFFFRTSDSMFVSSRQLSPHVIPSLTAPHMHVPLGGVAVCAVIMLASVSGLTIQSVLAEAFHKLGRSRPSSRHWVVIYCSQLAKSQSHPHQAPFESSLP